MNIGLVVGLQIAIGIVNFVGTVHGPLSASLFLWTSTTVVGISLVPAHDHHNAAWFLNPLAS